MCGAECYLEDCMSRGPQGSLAVLMLEMKEEKKGG